MAKEVDNHGGVSLQAAEAAASEACQFLDCGGYGVLHVALDPGVALFLGIELWRIGRQESRGKLVRVSREEALRGPRAMGLKPIPDDQQPRPKAAAKVAQGVDHDGAGDRTADMPGGQPAIGRDADKARNLPTLADPQQPRRVPPTGPGQPRPGAEGVPGLVDQDEGKAAPA